MNMCEHLDAGHEMIHEGVVFESGFLRFHTETETASLAFYSVYAQAPSSPRDKSCIT